jgi:hypothetical protein
VETAEVLRAELDVLGHVVGRQEVAGRIQAKRRARGQVAAGVAPGVEREDRCGLAGLARTVNGTTLAPPY